MKTNTTDLRSIEGPRAAWFHGRQKIANRAKKLLTFFSVSQSDDWSDAGLINFRLSTS